MLMAVVMAMPVLFVAVVVMAQGDGNPIRLAGTGALALAEIAAIGQPLHVVMVALLSQPHLIFKTEHLSAVLAKRAVHRRFSSDDFLHPFHKGVEHQGVISQILRRHEIHLRMIRGHQLGVLTDPAHQNTREEKVRKDVAGKGGW